MKNQVEIAFDINGKISKTKCPIISPGGLTPEQKIILDMSLKNASREIKNHFNNHGSWDLNTNTYVGLVLHDLFGCYLDEYIELSLIKRIKGTALVYKHGGPVFRNETERVFYNRKTNKVSVGLTAKDINNDINIGKL